MITEKEIKEKRKECIKKEHFTFRMLILLGAIRYNVEYLGDKSLNKWLKKYKVRLWHPLNWIVFCLAFIVGLFQTIIETFKGLKHEFKEKSFYI